ncbi:FAD/NAD(P)-binding domain-containing protein [Thozetella sp. PMI_491]|nr:FAD/NAD(P)-binding domain-containing protein [Thozetella sp. PMI_491]
MAPSAIPLEPEVSHVETVKAKVATSFNDAVESAYRIIEQPIGTRRALRVVCMGAGYSGLMMAIVFNERLRDSNATLTVYERNDDIGGTWLENRYPGCRCDIPAHNYSYSFCPNPNWPGYYATAEQIHGYMKDVERKYDCSKYIKCRHAIQSAIWNEQKGKWDLKVKDLDGVVFIDECDVFINAGGVLNNWTWPSIKGLDTFGGKLLHSARWDDSYDFTDKRIAVIGIGSSGIQIIPQLSKVVKSMDVHIRTQTWISPAPGINEPTANDPEMDADYNFTEKSLNEFKDPETLRQYRAAIMDRRIENFNRAMADSDIQKQAQELFRKSMLTRLGDSPKAKRIAEYLLPSFPVGCRRQTPGPGFLEALLQDNIETHWDSIEAITPRGIQFKNGEEAEYDAIVCATGFDTTFKPAFPIIGRNGVNLAQKWTEDRPKAYFGFCVPDMPNYFCFVGPNSPISNGSLILGIQATAMYVYKWINKLQTEGYQSFEVRDDVNEEYNEHMQQYLERTVWTRGCRSWYKRGTVDGPVVAIYGGTSFHFMEAITSPRWEDFHLKRSPEASVNRFAYLGNGFTIRETKKGSVGATQTLDFDEYWNLFHLPEIHN